MSANSTSNFTHRLRIVSLNTWHGLDHTRPLLMLPAENPIKAWQRKKDLIELLKSLRSSESRGTASSNKAGQNSSEAQSKTTETRSKSSKATPKTLDIFSLQELNPLSRVEKKLAQNLNMNSSSVGVNIGVRAGRFSYPFFLEEGLGIFWSSELKNPQSYHRFISGWGLDYVLPFKIALGFHHAERRGALMLRGEWESLRYTFVNLHLHSGPPGAPTERRILEIKNLLSWLDENSKDDDVCVLAGDFNAEKTSPEMALLTEAGYTHISNANGLDLPTWNPQLNALCAYSTSLCQEPEWRHWDQSVKAIDHIYVKRKDTKIKWNIEARLVGDVPTRGRWVSDHFGLQVDITWKQPTPKPKSATQHKGKAT